MGAIFGGLFSLLGGAVSGFFGLKQQQGIVISDAIKGVTQMVSASGETDTATANAVSAEASSGYWLAAVWRPLTMLVFLGIILSYWFGYTPPNMMSEHMPPMIGRLFDLLEIGIGGYIGGRSIEKIFNSIGMNTALKGYIAKKFA